MSFLQFLLLPFAFIYGCIVFIRNLLYDKNILKSYSLPIPVIGIGNLSTGGTGKTPMAEYILQLLIEMGYKPALLSRGYGRKTKGYILADGSSNASLIGDEPYQIYRKFPKAVVTVCEDRVEGIKRIMKDKPEVNVIVLDDCFQHRKLKAGLYILLTDYNKPYFRDYLLPSGRLRESMSGRKRADIIIMTKCPDVSVLLPRDTLKEDLRPLENQQICFTGLKYSAPVACFKNLPSITDLNGYSALTFTGIAKPKPFKNYVRRHTLHSKHISFADHHYFSEKDNNKIFTAFEKMEGEHKILLTTEKDWRRLENTPLIRTNLPLYYIPVGMKWDAMEKRSFDLKILDYVTRSHKANI